jgi:catechol 2,3-dioxygenase-like lactoylglutathione lyase family enzyme
MEVKMTRTKQQSGNMQRMVVAAAAAATFVAGAATAGAETWKLEQVRLLVTKFDETFLFYRDVVGLKATWGDVGQNYAALVFPDGAQIGLFKRAMMADAVGAAGMPATRREQDTAALVIAVDDIDATYQRLQARGVRFVAAPQSREAWGIRAAHFRDPDGNLIEVFSPLER